MGEFKVAQRIAIIISLHHYVTYKLTGSYDNTEAINISKDNQYQCVDDLLELIFLTDVFNTHQLKFSDLKKRAPPYLCTICKVRH